MSLTTWTDWENPTRFPRVSGDEPPAPPKAAFDFGFSPRERG